jgi:hypothetical protein
MSSVSCAPAKGRKPKKAEPKILSPSDPEYYQQPINSPSFEARKADVIKGLTAQYWLNKVLKKMAGKT